MDLVRTLDESPSKVQFALILYNTQLSDAAKLYIIESYPKECIDYEQLQRYLDLHPVQKEKYYHFLKLCRLDVATLETKLGIKIYYAPSEVVSLSVNDAQTSQQSEPVCTQLNENADATKFAFPKLVEHLLTKGDVYELSGVFKTKMQPHPQLFEAFSLFSEQFQTENRAKVLAMLDSYQLVKEKQSADRDAILLSAGCVDALKDPVTLQANEDLYRYWAFLSAGVADDVVLHSISNSAVGDVISKLHLEHFDMFYRHYCALRRITDPRFDSEYLSYTRDLLLQDSALYSGKSTFYILYHDELQFSVLVHTNAATPLTVSVFYVNTKVTALQEPELEDLVLTDPDFCFEIANSRSLQVHSFAILPDFQTDFIVRLALYQCEQAFFVRFHKAMCMKTLSADLLYQELQFSHKLVAGRNSVESNVYDELLNEFESLPYSRLGPAKLSVQQQFQVSTQPTFFYLMHIAQMAPDFTIFDTLNEESLLISGGDIIFNVYLSVRDQQQQIMSLDAFPCVLVLRAGEKATNFVSRGKNIHFKLPSRAQALELELKFVYSGKELVIHKCYQIRHYSCLRILRHREKFVLANMLDYPVRNEYVYFNAESQCGPVKHIISGDVAVSDAFEYVAASVDSLRYFKKTHKLPICLELGRESAIELFESGVKPVVMCEDFSKHYYCYRDNVAEKIYLFIRIGDFRVFYDGSFDVMPSQIMYFSTDYHSDHDDLITPAIPRQYYLQQRICVPFKTKDTYLIEYLLKKPHYGLACEILGLYMVENPVNGMKDMCSAKECSNCCFTAAAPCCAPYCYQESGMLQRSVRNYFTACGEATRHVTTIGSDGQIWCAIE